MQMVARIRRFSEPAFCASDAGGVDAIGGAQLGDRFGEVVADRAFGEVKLGGDLGAAAALPSTLKNLAFAFSEKWDFCIFQNIITVFVITRFSNEMANIMQKGRRHEKRFECDGQTVNGGKLLKKLLSEVPNLKAMKPI